MPKTCAYCGTELFEDDVFCPECGKGQSDIPENTTAVSMRKGSLILPRNSKCSLWAVILLLVGAVGHLLEYLLYLINNHTISELLWGTMSLFLLAAAVALLISRFTGMTIKIPLFILFSWSVSNLIFNMQPAIQLFKSISSLFRAGFSPYLFVIDGVFPFISTVMMLLFSFRLVKRSTTAITTGILMFTLMAIQFCQKIYYMVGFYPYVISVSNPTLDDLYHPLTLLFGVIFILGCAPGMFLTILSAKEKTSLHNGQ
ncbi:MAG TPA: zinc ribbon domain-containing protein [Oscillospiraceae bacterium]|mgnify:CR=1 FL=1|nr:zinc ribbon domain-containing protein [Oscillospiraceae bacterium]HPF55230.1 zinc ribbon domain-containing protein [Clostridiales bacterium]HPK35280.1 zinc ribbon domain-containing protein [Oscillospiraceae bacterium]HPR75473.1 zinc ribbon domain-containing protein [Oscillospiraceae bacterium]